MIKLNHWILDDDATEMDIKRAKFMDRLMDDGFCGTGLGTNEPTLFKIYYNADTNEPSYQIVYIFGWTRKTYDRICSDFVTGNTTKERFKISELN